jgi:transposase
MANRLAMHKSQGILSLAAAGHSERQIAEAVGVSRGAVRRHLGRDGSKRTKAPTGEAPTGSAGSNGTKAPTGSEAEEEDGLRGSRSLCAALRKEILAKLEQGLTAERIHQDLKAEHGFEGQYSSVRRYVHRLRQRRELPYRRIETAPGYELQVDYGTGARCRNATGEWIKTHVFRLVMSHSRKGYSEAVRRLTAESFIRSLENAFWALGGVPRVVVFDNAKSAVKQADWYDPELNPQLVEFCKYYDIVFQPTRPRTPRHKGKVERSVGYVKGNSLRGREFESLAAQNEHLRDWERTVADTRIHGTTKRHVGQVFETEERPALRPLPAERFSIFQEGQRQVSRDGHVEVARAYYSVPPEYLGCKVWVRWNEQTVRILNHRQEQIAVHVRNEPGKFSTRWEDIPPEKISGVERGRDHLMNKIRLLGPSTVRWSEGVLKKQGDQGLRHLQGVLSLSRRFDAGAIERACESAWRQGGFGYRIVKSLLTREETARQPEELLEEHPVIRPLAEYGEYVREVLEKE